MFFDISLSFFSEDVEKLREKVMRLSSVKLGMHSAPLSGSAFVRMLRFLVHAANTNSFPTVPSVRTRRRRDEDDSQREHIFTVVVLSSSLC